MKKRGGRKRALGTRAPMTLPQGPHQRWSLDFVSHMLAEGKSYCVASSSGNTGAALAAYCAAARIRCEIAIVETAPAELKVRLPNCMLSPPWFPRSMVVPEKLALPVTVTSAVASLPIPAAELSTREGAVRPQRFLRESLVAIPSKQRRAGDRHRCPWSDERAEPASAVRSIEQRLQPRR